MGDIGALEKICYPVFQCICNYWQLSRVTNNVEMDKFQRDIIQVLGNAKIQADRDPALSQEFAWIEKPLVFFIDYMVKEGCFPFSREWRELSRNYNELSGDEKFFDLLSQTVEFPNYRNSFALFYIMLGLGFDGVYRFNQKYIHQCMRLCMEKTRAAYDIYAEPLVPPPQKKSFFRRRRVFTARTALIAGAVFMTICLIINLAVFAGATKNYRALLEKTAADSVPALNRGPGLRGR
jgi:type VI protein secretion system component VasF